MQTILFSAGIVTALFLLQTQGNYIKNPNFESPISPLYWKDPVSPPEYVCEDWLGNYQLLHSIYPYTLNQGQCIELSPFNAGRTATVAGFAEQKITLEEKCYVNISYNWGVMGVSADARIYELTVLWNNEIVRQENPTIGNASFFVMGMEVVARKGDNFLTFSQTQMYTNQTHGIMLDNISVIYSREFSKDRQDQQNSIVLKILQRIFSLPKSLYGVKSMMFLLDELWLYVYDDRAYSPFLQGLFHTVQEVENFKWSIFGYHEKIPFLQTTFKSTKYAQFANPQYLKVENSDGLFIQAMRPLVLITLPQSLLLCLIFKLVFGGIRKYRMSIFLRRYCFYPSFFELLLGGNVGYLTYAFFNQCQILFSFEWIGKLYLAFSVLFWGLLLIFILGFFPLVNKFYQKKAGYFMHDCYRFPLGVLYLTFRIPVRMALSGVSHSLFFTNYSKLMISLCTLESLTLALTLCTEVLNKVFLTRFQWLLTTLYHCLFITLNLALYCEHLIPSHEQQQKQMFYFIQSCLVYMLFIVILLSGVTDFIPLQIFHYSAGMEGMEGMEGNEEQAQAQSDGLKRNSVQYCVTIIGVGGKSEESQQEGSGKQKVGAQKIEDGETSSDDYEMVIKFSRLKETCFQSKKENQEEGKEGKKLELALDDE